MVVDLGRESLGDGLHCRPHKGAAENKYLLAENAKLVERKKL